MYYEKTRLLTNGRRCFGIDFVKSKLEAVLLSRRDREMRNERLRKEINREKKMTG